MDVFKELTGVDLMDMQEKEMKKRDLQEEAKKKREAEEKKRKEEEEKKRKEEAENQLPEEERLKLQAQREAEAFKAQGNDYYKKRDFANALKFYQQAIDKCPNEITYYSNKAAVYFEQKDYDSCIAACDEAIESAKGGSYDYVKLGKAMARKANALLQKGMFDESIEIYQKALLENNDHGIKMGLQKAQKVKKEAEAKAYIDPAKAEEHKAAGSELYKKGEYPAALKEFDEGIKRNPDSVALYSNRCATLIKLMDITAALKDAEKCIVLDPKFVKAYARKGNCHHLMKEYHKAMKAFEDGLKIDPENKECLEGKSKTVATI